MTGNCAQPTNATATTAMRWNPVNEGDRAGLVAFQGENFWYFLAVGRVNGKRVIQVIERAGRATNGTDSVLVTASLPDRTNETVHLRITARRGRYDFAYATAPNQWTTLLRDADGTILSTKTAGGFVGTLFGLHAYSSR